MEEDNRTPTQNSVPDSESLQDASHDDIEPSTREEEPTTEGVVVEQEYPLEDVPIANSVAVSLDERAAEVVVGEASLPDVLRNGEVHTNGESIAAPPTPPKKEDRPEENLPRPPNPNPRFSTDTRMDSRAQSPSLSVGSSASPSTHKRSMTISKGHSVSVVLISSALEIIASSKEAKRSVPLRDSTQRALELIRSNEGGDRPREIFEPLRLACETRNEKLMIASLDCISKLISYSFFEDDGTSVHALPSPPPSPQPGKGPGPSSSAPPLPSLVDLVAHTITACHTETTPDTVSLQIVKALLSLVLSSSILVHHSSLLKAVRTVYNIFLLSTDPVNQMVAQGGLTQMVHHVFTRCRRGATLKAPSETFPTNGESLPSSNRESFAQSRPDFEQQPSMNGSNDDAASTTVSEKADEEGSEKSERPPLTL